MFFGGILGKVSIPAEESERERSKMKSAEKREKITAETR
jgi:hypothetical protein